MPEKCRRTAGSVKMQQFENIWFTSKQVIHCDWYFSDPNREIICDILMKSNAKAKSFHVVMWGNHPQHVTSPSWILIRRPATSGWQQQLNHRKNHRMINRTIGRFIAIISRIRNHRTVNHQWTTYRSRRHGVNDHPPNERSVVQVIAMEPLAINRAIRRTSSHRTVSDQTRDPSSESSPRNRKRSNKQFVKQAATILANHGAAAMLALNELLQRWACAPNRQYASVASGTTVDREGDGRIREELESLGGSGAHKVMTRLRSLDWR